MVNNENQRQHGLPAEVVRRVRAVAVLARVVDADEPWQLQREGDRSALTVQQREM